MTYISHPIVATSQLHTLRSLIGDQGRVAIGYASFMEVAEDRAFRRSDMCDHLIVLIHNGQVAPTEPVSEHACPENQVGTIVELLNFEIEYWSVVVGDPNGGAVSRP